MFWGKIFKKNPLSIVACLIPISCLVFPTMRLDYYYETSDDGAVSCKPKLFNTLDIPENKKALTI
jgi:hypothetical protein